MKKRRVTEGLASDSLDGLADEIREAWLEAASMWDPDKDGDPGPGWVTDVYPDAVIVRDNGGDFYRVPYTRDADGDPVFGDAVEVQVKFEAVQEALVREGAELLRPADLTGAEWDARIVRFGVSANGWEWTRESAESLLPLLEGAPVCAYAHGQHAPEATIAANNGPVREAIVGTITQPRLEADGIYGRVRIAEAHAPLRARLLELARAGARAVAGLSVDTISAYVPVKVAEAVVKRIKQVKRLFSVDIVDAPSAGGGLIRATAGPISQEDTMKREELIALVRESRPQLLEGKDITKLTDAELASLVREALKPPPAEPKKDTPPGPKKDEPQAEPAWAREARAREVKTLVREALDGKKLPELVVAKLRKQFTARVVEAEGMPAFAAEVETAVKEEVELHAALSKSGEPAGYGGTTVVIAPVDKLQAAMDRLFDVSKPAFDGALATAPFLRAETAGRVKEALSPIEVKDPGLQFRGIREAYVQITGDSDITGLVRKGRVAESVDSATWSFILQNSLYRRFLMDYMAVEFHERSIAEYGRAEDFRSKQVVILNYFSDIDTVDPESADYAEIAAPGDAQVSYSVGQKGNILTITRKTIINDDLRAIAKMVGRMGRAFRRTLAKAIWTNWGITAGSAGAVYGPDSLNWFESGTHKNTGSTALTADATGATEVLAKITQLISMTEQGSGEKLGMPPIDSLWLDVPPALYGVARMLNLTQFFGTTAANPIYGMFGAPERGERINMNVLFGDTTDWGVHVSPGAGGRESVLVDFLQGQEEPAFFLADQPTVGQAFVGDRIQYKGRHEYGVALLDFRGATKNVVAGS